MLCIDNMLLRIITFIHDALVQTVIFVFDRISPDNDGLVHACVMCAYLGAAMVFILQ